MTIFLLCVAGWLLLGFFGVGLMFGELQRIQPYSADLPPYFFMVFGPVALVVVLLSGERPYRLAWTRYTLNERWMIFASMYPHSSRYSDFLRDYGGWQARALRWDKNRRKDEEVEAILAKVRQAE